MELKDMFFNFIYATLIFFFGAIGMLIIRIAKGKWNNVTWSYIPVFWIPVITSWPVAIAALIGKFDE